MFPLALMMVMDDDDRNYMITIYEQYQWLMLAVARKYVQTKYDQEEVISEACMALIKNISTLRTLKGKKLPAYIVTTVKNKARDYLNRQNTLRNRSVPIDGVSYTVEKGYSYRTYAVGRIYNKAGVLLERVTATSKTVAH